MAQDYAFEAERQDNRRALAADGGLAAAAKAFMLRANQRHYSYGFDWMGLPIIQYPADIVAVQELIWRIRPEVVVETGVARGGSLALSASVLELLGGDGFVVGVEIELREANRKVLEAHPLAHRFRLVDGSSIDRETVDHVRDLVSDRGPVVVFLDSNHTYEHVLRELELYSGFVTKGSFLVVFDTVIEHMGGKAFPDRPWHPGNSPMTAVDEFLARADCRFEVDEEFDSKLLITVAPSGYLRCIR